MISKLPYLVMIASILFTSPAFSHGQGMFNIVVGQTDMDDVAEHIGAVLKEKSELGGGFYELPRNYISQPGFIKHDNLKHYEFVVVECDSDGIVVRMTIGLKTNGNNVGLALELHEYLSDVNHFIAGKIDKEGIGTVYRDYWNNHLITLTDLEIYLGIVIEDASWDGLEPHPEIRDRVFSPLPSTN